MDKISDAEHAQAEVASDFLSAMANPKRLLILKVLGLRGHFYINTR